MGARSGPVLKGLQFFVRSVQFCCAALILAILAYFLATLAQHDLPVPTWVRAVTGISGAAVLYSALFGIALLCCVAGHPVSSFLLMVLDVCFAGAFIYIATANRDGASSCHGQVTTPYGTGDAGTNVVNGANGDGMSGLPSLRQACQMQTACLSVAIGAMFFFIFSALLELALVRHRRKEKRFGPGPANGYTSGYGKKGPLGFLGIGRNKSKRTGIDPDSTLPQHTQPADLRNSYASTDHTRIGSGGTMTSTTNQYGKYESSPYGQQDGYGNVNGSGYGNGYHQNGVIGHDDDALPHMQQNQQAHYPPANYRYSDGVYDRT